MGSELGLGGAGGGGFGLGEFFDALLGLGEDVSATADQSDPAFIVGDGVFEPVFAGFDALDDGFQAFEGLLEGQIVRAWLGGGCWQGWVGHMTNVASWARGVQRGRGEADRGVWTFPILGGCCRGW